MGTYLALLSGGLVAGVGHVFSGPDHLAAVLPFAVSQPRRAVRVGISWGLGHGLGVALLGGLALLVREWVDVEAVSQWAELAVGVLLLYLGLRAIRASRVLTIHDHPHDHGHGHVHSHAHVHFNEADHEAAHGRPPVHRRHQHSAFAVGAFHGVAGTAHLVTILPAVASDAGPAVAYLVSYLVGAVGGMAAFSLGAKAAVRDQRRVPRALQLAGITAIAVGVFWIVRSLPEV
ncbi:MAG: sulfite exporter TauE/SafE family protein [Myxococcota bacterium]